MICIGHARYKLIYHGKILLMENKHYKWFTVRQSKRLKFTPKMLQNAFGGREEGFRKVMMSVKYVVIIS